MYLFSSCWTNSFSRETFIIKLCFIRYCIVVCMFLYFLFCECNLTGTRVNYGGASLKAIVSGLQTKRKIGPSLGARAEVKSLFISVLSLYCRRE